LNEDMLGILEQSAFHEKQSAIILEAMDQNHIAAIQIVASLAPFQVLIEARRKAQLAERGIFGAPASFLAMKLCYARMHQRHCRCPRLDDNELLPGQEDQVSSQATRHRNRRRGFIGRSLA